MNDWEDADLLALLDDTPHEEIVVETERQRTVFRRTRDHQWVRETTTLRSPVQLSGSASAATRPLTPPATQVSEKDGLISIRAPLPGIFYRAPKPGATPFVELGAPVSRDTVVGIIETMKLMNSVAAGTEGEIAEFCITNGAPIETDDVIMRVRPR